MNQLSLKLLLLAFSVLNGTYQDCSFLLLISYYYNKLNILFLLILS